MNWTITQVARKYGLSRSTLLYYDAIGLLRPRRKSGNNYRFYQEKDLIQMEEVCRLRNAGIPLQEIKQALCSSGRYRRVEALRRRLQDINREIRQLRDQQRVILELLGEKEIADTTRILTKEKWIACLKKAGMSDAEMERWHTEFELSSPEAHQDFLESLGLPEEEIRRIREHYRQSGKEQTDRTAGS